MKFVMFVCWDAGRMDAAMEPDAKSAPEPESFPWLDELVHRNEVPIGWCRADVVAFDS